jgi:hypothetical protein
LNTSEKINLMKEITDLLKEESWTIIDLILGEFGFPIVDNYNGDIESYILHIIRKQSNNKLIELANHLGIIQQDTTLLEETDLSCWQPRRFRLFISHLASDKEYTTELQDALNQYHIYGFVAHKDIEPATDWLSTIELALNSSFALIALITPDFHKSNWTDQEIGVIIGRGRLIVPVRLGKDPYGFIGQYQGIQGLNKTCKDTADEIFTVLNKHKLTQKKIAEAAINKFEDCSSFEEAKISMDLLERLIYMDDSLIERIVQASEQNSQIKNSYVVPARVTSFVNKYREVTSTS